MASLSRTRKPSSVVLFFLCSIFLLNIRQSSSFNNNTTDNDLQQFNTFVANYKKAYLLNATEFKKRFEIFQKNIIHADFLNKAYHNISQPVHGISKFSDLKPEEFKAKYLSGLKVQQSAPHHSVHRPVMSSGALKKELHNLRLPKKVDWRERGVLSSVKDQGQCGACWAFSVAETMESMYAIQLNTTAPDLSEQELIDCDIHNSGCEGGDICEATRWASKNGLVAYKNYPFTHHTDKCKNISTSVPRLRVKNDSCENYVGSEADILSILAEHGPVAVAVDATTWHSYVGGIIRFHCSATVNHAVQIVGYDMSGEIPFYIIRNSWGKDFGDKGFMYIKYGDNLCGLASRVASLTVDV